MPRHGTEESLLRRLRPQKARRGSPRPNPVRPWRRAVAAAVTVAALSVSGIAGGPAAYAAGQGPGFGTWPSSTIGWEGGVVAPDGSIAYCFEPGHSNPIGSTTDGGVQGVLTSSTPFGSNTVAGDTLARINRVVTEYGQSWDNVQASAVSFVVKHLANPEAMYRSSGWNGSRDLSGFINWKLVRTVGSATVAAIQSRAHEILSATEGTVAGAGGAGSGSVSFSIDPVDNYDGTATVRLSPASAVATVNLVNGVFADTGSSTMTGLHDGQTVRVRGVPPSADGTGYRISATGRAEVAAGFAGNVRVWHTAGQQGVAGPGERAGGGFAIAGEDAADRSVRFQPIVTTLTGTVTPDGKLVDALTFATAPDEAGSNNRWPKRTDGTAFEVAFDVTAYGPFSGAPAVSDDPPPGASAVETVTVLSGPEGPGGTATAAFTGLVPGGVYTFVATYSAESTPSPTRAFIAEGYAWKHGFGIAEETTIVPMDLELSSQIGSSTVPLSGPSTDTVIVENRGVWLEREGAPVTVILRGDYVYVPMADEDADPVPVDALPADARVVATRYLRVDRPGAYEITDPPTAVASGTGYMTWRWSLQRADQPAETAEWVLEDFERYLDPTQTQEILQPEISTKAQAGTVPDDTASDTAIVGGTLPANGAVVTFEAFDVPIEAPEDLEDVCVAENLVFSDADTGQTIMEPGEYPGPEMTTSRYAKTLWVESLWSVPVDDEEPELIARGECGVRQETTFTVDVTTQVRTTGSAPEVEVGERIWDTSETRGWVPEGGRHMYHVYTWQGSTPVCDDTTLIATLESTRGTLDGGLYPDEDPLVEDSEPLTVPASARGGSIGFVEHLVDEIGRTVSKGECGDATETARVAGPPLAATGGGAVPLWMPVAGGAAVVGGITAVIVGILRRRTRPVDA